MTKYKYEHPDGTGLGAQLAPDEDLSRAAQPPEVATSMRAALSVVSPTDSQSAELEGFLSRTMDDLDMANGTEVELVMNDDPDDPGYEQPLEHEGLKVVEWTDAHGNPRRTSVTDEVFEANFKEVAE
jgi:hypothetical protein